MRKVALVFAGGVGSRMNSKARPKQFLEIHGKPIIVHTIEQFENHPEIDDVCVVIVEAWLDYMRSLVKKFHLTKVKWVLAGGDSALSSQYNGLSAIAAAQDCTKEDIVLIHDGVRPLINEQLISDCIASVKTFGSAVTVAPATETIVQTNENGESVNTIPRKECQLARAPQCFYLKDI
ncbi:MAG: 2-C-methyl-D-erythritol 4-phosphate cytidylyltransferase, partial [Lentisphaeria bacterium]|nr:2-C-methyl-D-erythritol 4-phosphate cytidylyltransferase [Lentisphaeria bacterium]